MATKYWYGGAGTWDSTDSSGTHWSLNSGNSPSSTTTAPTTSDDVVFDANSGTGSISVSSSSPPSVKSVTCTGIPSTLKFDGTTTAGSITIAGDLVFGSGQTFGTLVPSITFVGTGSQKLTFNSVQFSANMTINAGAGTYTLQDAFYTTQQFQLTSGTLDCNSYNVTCGRFISTGSTARTVKMGGGQWTIQLAGTVWNLAGSNLTVESKGSVILLTATNTTARTFNGFNQVYGKLTIGGSAGTSTLTITGNNRFSEIASTKTVAHTILFTAGSFNIVDRFSVTGTAGNIVTVGSTSTSQAIVQKASPWYIGTNSTDAGNNTGVSTLASISGDTNDYISMSYIRGEYVGGSMISFFA